MALDQGRAGEVLLATEEHTRARGAPGREEVMKVKILNWLRHKARRRDWAARLYWLLSKKYKAICFNCGRDFEYTMEDPGAPEPWTEQGKMPCIPCFTKGINNEAPIRNHGNFSSWQEGKLEQ